MKKARSQKLKKFNKVLSVLLAAAMVAGSVPDVSLVAHATEAETEAAEEKTSLEEVDFLSEENADTADSDAADAVSESISEEVSTAEEQQPSEEAVPTEEEVSEEAVSTQEASSTEENKESEATSTENTEAVSTESVSTEASEDNTAGEEEVTADESIAPEAGETATVAITPDTAKVEKGATQEFTATVTIPGTGDGGSTEGAAREGETVTWTVEGANDSNGTKIEAAASNANKATLTVSASETAATLTVKATYTAGETSVVGEATVTVTEPAQTETKHNVTPTFTLATAEAKGITGVTYSIDTATPEAAASGTPIEVLEGKAITFTITVSEGYELTVPADAELSETAANTYTYTIENIAKDETVTFTAAEKQIKIFADDTNLSGATLSFTTDTVEGSTSPYTVKKGEDGAIIAPEFTVSVTGNTQEVDKVQYTVGTSTAKKNAASETTEGTTKYTIPAADITGDVTIYVTLKYKPQEVTFVYQYDDASNTAIREGVSVSPVNGGFTKDAENKYYTVDKKDLAFNVTVDASKVQGEIKEVTCSGGANSVRKTTSKAYVITNKENQITDAVTVTIKVSKKYKVNVPSGITVQYALQADVATKGFSALPADKMLPAGSYYFTVDAGDKAVKAVTYKAADATEDTEATNAISSIQAGYKAYAVTIADKDINLAVETEDAANAKTVAITKTGEGIEGIYYLLKDSEGETAFNAATFTKITGTNLVLTQEEAGKKLYIYAKLNENYTTKAVMVNNAAATISDKAYLVPLDGAAPYSFSIETKPVEVAYTFNAFKTDATADIMKAGTKIVIKPENIVAVGDATTAPTADTEITTETATDTVVKVNKGKKITFTVSVKEGYEATVTGANKRVKDGKTYYEIIANTAADVSVAVTAVAAPTITWGEKTDITALEEKIDGELQTEAVSSVPYGSSYEFSVKEIAANKAVDYVLYSEDAASADDENATWKELQSPYKFEKVTKNLTIKIFTKLDTAKVNAFSFTYNADEVTVAVTKPTALLDKKGTELTGITDYNKTFYAIAPTAPAVDKLTFTVTPKAGLKAAVTGATAVKDADGKDTNTYEVDLAAGTVKAVTIATSVDTEAATTDQYVKITNNYDENAVVEVAGLTEEDEVAVTETSKTYLIKKDKKEVTFTVTVPKFEKLDKENNTIADNTAVYFVKEEASADKKHIVYTFKIVLAAITGTTENAPKTITVSSNDFEPNSAVLTIPEEHSNVLTESNAGSDYLIGTRIIIQVDEGFNLFQQTAENEKTGEITWTPCKLDVYGKYAFTIEEDTIFDVKSGEEAAEESDYVVSYVEKLIDDYGDPMDGKSGAYDGTPIDITKNAVYELTAATKDTSARTAAPVGNFTDVECYASDESEIKSTAKAEGEEGSKNKVKVNLSAEDAGKEIHVALYTDVEVKATNDEGQETVVEVKEHVWVGTVVFAVAPNAASAVVTSSTLSFKQNTVKMDALTTADFDVVFTPSNVTLADYDVTVAPVSGTNPVTTKAEYKVTETDGKKQAVISVTAAETKEKAKVSVIKKGAESALCTFVVETVLPSVKLVSVESPAQTENTISLAMTADKSVGSDNVYYEIATTTGTTTTVKYVKKTAERQAYQIPGLTASTKYTVAVRLVISKTDLSAQTAVVENKNLVAYSAAKKVTATTKASQYYEDKLSVTKKTTTLYTGQDNVLAAVVKFSKNTSKVENVHIKRVLNSDGTVASGISVENDDNKNVLDLDGGYGVYLNVDDNVALGKYTVEIEADSVPKASEADLENGQYSMYRATATLPITVVAGINNIDVARDVKIAKIGKNVTYTFKPVGYINQYKNGNYIKAKSQKFTYELDLENLSDIQKKNVLDNVTLKNNKLTVKNSFVVGNDPADNAFYVNVKANDFSGNDEYASVKVEITDAALTISDMYLVDSMGKRLGSSISKSEASSARLVIEDASGEDISKYMSVTPANKLAKNKSNGSYYFIYNAIKPGVVSIKATPTDGGKNTAKTLKVTIAYDKFTDMNYEIGARNLSLEKTSADNYSYKAKTVPTFTLNVFDGKERAYQSYYNYTIKVTGGIQLSKNGSQFIPTAKETKVTLKDTNKGGKTITIKLTNDEFAAEKAPAASTKNKLYYGLHDVDGVETTQSIQYTVKGKQYEYVNVIANSTDFNHLSTGVLKIAEDNTFTLTTDSVDTDYNNKLNAVKYTLVYGHKDSEGNFIPETKPATISVKAVKAAAFKPVTSYTINAANSKSVALSGKPAEVPVAFSYLQNGNVGGQPNKFRDLFELKDGILTLKVLPSDAQFATLTAKKDADGKKQDNLFGYVTYKYYNTEGVAVEKTVKITVKINEKQVAYKADAVSVLTNTEVTTTIRQGTTPVAISAAAGELKSGTEGWSVTTTADNAADGIVTLKYTGAGKGSQKVKLEFITADSANVGKGVFSTVTVSAKVFDPTDTKAKKIAPKNVTIDLNSSKAEQSYANNVGTYKLAMNNTYTKQATGVEVTGMAVEDTTGNLAGIRVAYTPATQAAAEKVEFSVDTTTKNLDKKGNITVPVKVTFANNAEPEILSFKLVTPKPLPTQATVTEKVNSYLANFHRTGDTATEQAADQKTITDALNGTADKQGIIDGVTGITAAVKAEYKAAVEAVGDTPAAPASYTVEVTLTVPGAAEPVKLPTVNVKEPLQDLAAAKAAVEKLVENIVGTKTETETDKKLAAELNTEMALRAYLKTAIKNSEIGLEISEYEYKAPVDGDEKHNAGKEGELRFTCKLFTQTGEEELGTKTVTIPAKAYTSSTTTKAKK